MDQNTLSGFHALGFYLPSYVSKYHAWRDDVLPGSILCDSPLDFVIQVPNILEIGFGSTDRVANKNTCLWLWSVFEQ